MHILLIKVTQSVATHFGIFLEKVHYKLEVLFFIRHIGLFFMSLKNEMTHMGHTSQKDHTPLPGGMSLLNRSTSSASESMGIL